MRVVPVSTMPALVLPSVLPSYLKEPAMPQYGAAAPVVWREV